jgi:hypothetical protein
MSARFSSNQRKTRVIEGGNELSGVHRKKSDAKERLLKSFSNPCSAISSIVNAAFLRPHGNMIGAWAAGPQGAKTELIGNPD